MKYADITQKIIGCAMTVHNTLGNGFQEVIYQRALAVEFAYQGILFRDFRKNNLPIIKQSWYS